MKITHYSKNKLYESASRWQVPREYFDPLFNYLLYGFEPGSFWTAVLANDFFTAMQASHPGNTIESLKHTTGWIRDAFPLESYGSYETVKGWIESDESIRRVLLESVRMIYTEKEEVEMALRGTPIKTLPILW